MGSQLCLCLNVKTIRNIMKVTSPQHFAGQGTLRNSECLCPLDPLGCSQLRRMLLVVSSSRIEPADRTTSFYTASLCTAASIRSFAEVNAISYGSCISVRLNPLAAFLLKSSTGHAEGKALIWHPFGRHTKLYEPLWSSTINRLELVNMHGQSRDSHPSGN